MLRMSANSSQLVVVLWLLLGMLAVSAYLLEVSGQPIEQLAYRGETWGRGV